ncbi:Cation/H(+) antiporter 15 [Platanthera guangdongensis]|uniref:Cation/H(+) antiporter 15 n=1 Tax=Platanthera guangdongensis TaxID=2320717 RepID=A0ABR2M615_9ASPA
MAIVTPQEFYANFTSEVKSIFCYDAVQTTSPGIWLVDNPLMFSFPLLLFQLTLIFLFTRITQSILSHLFIPIHISQIIGGIILGPSCLGRYRPFENIMYSPVSWEQLNVISFLAIFLFPFFLGLILPGGAPLGCDGGEVGKWRSTGVLHSYLKVLLLFLIMVVVGKFFGAMLPCFYCKMPIRDCLAVGLMMISKGIYEAVKACKLQDFKVSYSFKNSFRKLKRVRI